MAAIEALTKILLLSPGLSLEHEESLSQCLSRGTLVEMTVIRSFGSMAAAHPVHHAHTLEMLGRLALDAGRPSLPCCSPPLRIVCWGGQRVGEMEVRALEGFGAAHALQELLTV